MKTDFFSAVILFTNCVTVNFGLFNSFSGNFSSKALFSRPDFPLQRINNHLPVFVFFLHIFLAPHRIRCDDFSFNIHHVRSSGIAVISLDFSSVLICPEPDCALLRTH